MPTTYNVITTIGIDTVTADRCRKDEHGDIQFYNGSRDTPPVGEYIRDNTVAVLPEGR